MVVRVMVEGGETSRMEADLTIAAPKQRLNETNVVRTRGKTRLDGHERRERAQSQRRSSARQSREHADAGAPGRSYGRATGRRQAGKRRIFSCGATKGSKRQARGGSGVEVVTSSKAISWSSQPNLGLVRLLVLAATVAAVGGRGPHRPAWAAADEQMGQTATLLEAMQCTAF